MIVDIDLSNRDVVFIHKKEFRTVYYTGVEIENDIKKLLGFFTKNKIKKGDKILVLGQNSPQLAAVFLAAIRAGIILVPLDIHSSFAFIKKVKQQTKAKIFFTDTPIMSLKIKTVFIENLFENLDETYSYKENKINENDIIEIVYTSGTTGDPKGVILTHKNIATNISQLEELYDFKDETLLSLLPLSHVFEQTVGFFLPLKIGAKIVYLEKLNSREIAKVLKEQKITISLVVPRILRLFKERIEEKIKEKRKQDEFALFRHIAKNLFLKKIFFRKIHKQFHYLKFFVVGGAFLDPKIEEFYEDIGIPLYQGYGLTEASPVISANYPGKKMLYSIGKILPNIKAKIVNGEIWVKGNSVFSGYYKRPDKNRESFSGGWFKTGDLGYIKNGFLYFKGRKKEIIVTEAGINIYPEDIESILNNHPAVKEGCIVDLNGKIHAAVLLKKDIPIEDIILEANKQLSASQQISSYSLWPFEDFPHTPTMKIKRFEVQGFIAKKQMPQVHTYEDRLNLIISKFTNK
ncbi:MAG: AMP-binding protein, partial [Candidatus Woesearchaeota archaeon]